MGRGTLGPTLEESQEVWFKFVFKHGKPSSFIHDATLSDLQRDAYWKLTWFLVISLSLKIAFEKTEQFLFGFFPHWVWLPSGRVHANLAICTC